jgi:hypothetical protein
MKVVAKGRPGSAVAIDRRTDSAAEFADGGASPAEASNA